MNVRPPATAADLGRWLKTLRDRSPASQAKAAAAGGIEVRVLRRWEKKPTKSQVALLKVLDAYGVTFTEDITPPSRTEEIRRVLNDAVAEAQRLLEMPEEHSA